MNCDVGEVTEGLEGVLCMYVCVEYVCVCVCVCVECVCVCWPAGGREGSVCMCVLNV